MGTRLATDLLVEASLELLIFLLLDLQSAGITGICHKVVTNEFPYKDWICDLQLFFLMLLQMVLLVLLKPLYVYFTS